MSIPLELSPHETATIRCWYEYAADDSFHYGGSQLFLPSEQLLLKKLESHVSGTISLTPLEVACIADWMHRTIEKRYGSEKYLFGFELQVYFKIRAAVNLCA